MLIRLFHFEYVLRSPRNERTQEWRQEALTPLAESFDDWTRIIVDMFYECFQQLDFVEGFLALRDVTVEFFLRLLQQ